MDWTDTVLAVSGGSVEKGPGFAQNTLDCLPFHIAIVNESGIITYVNRAWKDFAVSNGAPALQNCRVGSDYLEVCRSAAVQEAYLAREATAGLESVLRREKALFELEYPCNSPTGERWFLMTVSRLDETEGWKGGAVTVHQNVTARKLAAQEQER
jgi:two-component system, chemotaxis family, CheB/CheR fusion protein